MLIALLIILAGASYVLGIRANLRALQHLAPGATLNEVRDLTKALSPRGAQVPGGRERLKSLYTARGWQLRQFGFLLLGICAMTLLVLIFQLVFHTHSPRPATVRTDTIHVLTGVTQNKPSIFLVWVATFVLAWLGFVGARFNPWLAIPIAATIVIWSHQMTGIFPGGHLIGTHAERSYVLQVMAGSAIAILATGQGIRYWAIRSNKRAQQKVSGSA